ncbi:ABC transporter substrate-binding protein [Chelatococcus reniformis]|uniref:ABC transporter substrate-binding protein n=1 Tax=Chelatococcus reniformis TaxID=1494448 RepID=A0A916UIZ4_9HYPH|nr:ABC transporter substrate-binding protein [Chelatococcus reniformis]GGC74660.1 ABC transporter substrate-binding protein [Chelatococcus reniformis]
MSGRRSLLLAVAAAAAIAAAAPVRAETVTLRDAMGRDVVLPRPARRLVTIFASNTELVAALGLADRIVGIESYTRYPPEVVGRRPLVGGRLGFSVDRIVALAPDLVVLTPSRQAMHQVLDPMARVGIPVLVLLARSVDEVLDNIRLLGRATGVAERGEAVAGALAGRLAAVRARIDGRPRPKVLLVTGQLGNGLILVVRDATYTADALRLAGADLALVTASGLPQVSPESALASDPDVLLLAGRQDELDALVARPGWRNLRAVKAGRAHIVPRAELLIPGPRTIDGIERLAMLLHPGDRER